MCVNLILVCNTSRRVLIYVCTVCACINCCPAFSFRISVYNSGDMSFTKNSYIIIFDETVNIMYSSKNYVEFTRNKEGCGLLKPDLEMS